MLYWCESTVKWPSMTLSATLWDTKMFPYWDQLAFMYILTFYSPIKTYTNHRLLKLNILTDVTMFHDILKMKMFCMH